MRRHKDEWTGQHARLSVLPSGGVLQTDSAAPNYSTTLQEQALGDDDLAVRSPASSESQRLQLEENAEECMVDTPAYVCFEKFGSYGIRRLHTEGWNDIIKLGYHRPDWMAHENVQRRHMFNLTFPGTHNSGSYDFQGEHEILGKGLAFGAQNQHMSVDKQLEAGIRAFDLRVSYSFREQRLYLSHGLLTVPLADVLGQMRAFLDKRRKEVLLVHAKIGRVSHKLNSGHREPLMQENDDPRRVPGEMVHRLLLHHLGGLLATHATLSALPIGENLENPRISSLVDINVRVFYFWEGQQVLCTDLARCRLTPGWTQPWSGLAFGWPLPLGERAAAIPAPARVIEPACLLDSWQHTASAHPDRVVKNLKAWAFDLETYTASARPSCFPSTAVIPPPHTPTLFYWADAQVTLTETENAAQRLLLGHAWSLFTRGEGFTLKTSAERVNYLMLAWFMKKGARALFTRPNVIAHDFVQPVLVHRIIEAMQERQECGWAMTCWVTGSCWAASLLGPDGECRPEEEVLRVLEAHAAAKGVAMFWKVLLGFTCFTAVLAVVCWWRCPRRAKGGAAEQAAEAGPSATSEAAAVAGPKDAVPG